MTVTAAELDTDQRNALGASSFALPRQRKLPLDTAARVRNALARFGQIKDVPESDKAAAKGRIKAAAKKFGIEVSDDFSEWAPFAEPLLVALAETPVEDFAEGSPLTFLKVGEFDFDDYGPIHVTEDDLDGIVRNFHANARRGDLPVANADHAPPVYNDEGDILQGPGAIGWIKDMYRDGDTVYFVPDWNPAGERLLADDRFRGVSPELLLNWTDPETLESWGMTASGVALTNKPRMKSLAVQGHPLVAGEGRVLAYAERPYVFATSANDGADADGDDDGDGGNGDGAAGQVSCPTCKGSGKLMGGKRDCPDCDGSGKVAQAKAAKLKAAELTDVHVDAPMSTMSVAYAYPDRKRLPLHTAEAVKGARARFMTIEASEQERDTAWGELRKAAEQHGVDVPPDWRHLKASESASLLMQEEPNYLDDTALDVASGMLPPCVFQPPYSDFSRCPGFTRDDPDKDGDSDCCALAAKGCNGYIPLLQVQPPATFVTPQSATYYHEPPGGQMSDKTTSTKREDPPAVQASEPATPVTETAAAQATAPAAAADTAPAAPTATAPAEATTATVATAPPIVASEPAAKADPAAVAAASQAAANLAEVQSILAAERRERESMATRLAAAESNVQTERDARLRMEAATRLAEVASRVENLVRSGRITPAQRDLLMAEPVKFSEDDNLLKVLEAAPENNVVDMRERGSGADETRPESDRLEVAAKALMSERNQPTDSNDSHFFQNYKRALLDVGRSGYRAR